MKKTVAFCYLFFCSLLLSHPVSAKPKINFNLSLSEEYSDNINHTETYKDDSFITELSPLLNISDEGARTDYSATYNYRYLEYTNDDAEHRKEQTLNSVLNRYEFDRSLQLFINGQMYYRTLNTLHSTIGDGVTGEERVKTMSSGAGFNYESGLRQWHNTSLSAQFKHTETENDEVNNDLITASFSIANGKRSRALNWQLKGDIFKDSNENENQIAFSKIGYQITDIWSMFGQAQYEEVISADEVIQRFMSWGTGIEVSGKNSRLAIAHNKVEKGENNDFTSIDFSWTPTAKTTLAGSYTTRFFGESYSLNLQHQTRKLKNKLSYQDSITTFSQQGLINQGLGFLVCPEGQLADPSRCYVPESLIQPLEPGYELVGIEQQVLNVTEDEILNRTLSHTTSYSFSKTIVSASLFWNRTKVIIGRDFDTKDYDKEIGGSLIWNWRIGSKTSFSLDGTFRDISADNGTTNEANAEETSIRASITKKLTQKIIASFAYTHLERSSDTINDSFSENRIAASAIIQF